jgi:hypothetical protein
MPKTKSEIAHDVDELLRAKGGGRIMMRHLESIAAQDAADAESRHPREVKELEKYLRAARNSLINAENAAAAIWGRGSEQVRDVDAVIRMLGDR